MPVNLIGHQAGSRNELSMILVRDVQRKNLFEIAEETQNKKHKSKKDMCRVLLSEI